MYLRLASSVAVPGPAGRKPKSHVACRIAFEVPRGVIFPDDARTNDFSDRKRKKIGALLDLSSWNNFSYNMKFTALAAAALIAGPAAAEVYFKEQFNDEVRAFSA